MRYGQNSIWYITYVRRVLGCQELAQNTMYSFAWTTKMRTYRGDQNDNETIMKTIRNCSKKNAV